MQIIYRSPKSKKEFEDYFDFRWQTLRKPLNLLRGSEQDELEDTSFHIAAYEEQTLVGIGRLHTEINNMGRIRYMAVDPKYRGKGVGSSILRELEDIAQTNNLQACWLNAREDAIPFYLKNGYEIKGEANSELTIEHKRMEKVLD